jgi:hypothetical protein
MLACENSLAELIDNEELIPILAIFMGCLTGMIGIVAGTISGVVKTRAKENTKRELAAYVAEGTLRPEDAVAIANSGSPKWEQADISGMS